MLAGCCWYFEVQSHSKADFTNERSSSEINTTFLSPTYNGRTFPSPSMDFQLSLLSIRKATVHYWAFDSLSRPRVSFAPFSEIFERKVGKIDFFTLRGRLSVNGIHLDSNRCPENFPLLSPITSLRRQVDVNRPKLTQLNLTALTRVMCSMP